MTVSGANPNPANPWLAYAMQHQQPPLPSHPFAESDGYTARPLPPPTEIFSQRSSERTGDLFERTAQPDTLEGVNQFAVGTTNVLTHQGSVARNVVQQGGKGFNSYGSVGNADQVLQDGSDMLNNATITGQVGGVLQAGVNNINQLTLGELVNKVIMSGQNTLNDANLATGAKKVTMQGEGSFSRLTTQELIQLETDGADNLHQATVTGSTQNVWLKGTGNTTQLFFADKLGVADLQGTGNDTTLHVTGDLGQAKLAGTQGQTTLVTKAAVGRLALEGDGHTGRVSLEGDNKKPTLTVFNGKNNTYDMLATSAQHLVLRGDNNTLNIATGTLSEQAGKGLTANRDDKADLGGTGTYSVDLGEGNDKVLIRELSDTQGKQTAEVFGGSGVNHLLLEGEGWEAEQVDKDTIRYTKGEQSIVAHDFAPAQAVTTGSLTPTAFINTSNLTNP
jgi:hypothetical protein